MSPDILVKLSLLSVNSKKIIFNTDMNLCNDVKNKDIRWIHSKYILLDANSYNARIAWGIPYLYELHVMEYFNYRVIQLSYPLILLMTIKK